MSMLAQPRRKKEYVLNPRGKALYNDENRFGSKMMQKMGWTKGKGLGAKESGNVDFVRINFKSGAAGLGFQDRNDQWTEHEKGFNGLLTSLRIENGCNDDEVLENTISEDKIDAVGFGFKQSNNKLNKLTEKISGQSLEEKSKQSKARVHYKKYTKGKDLTQYSEKDLANIFGKKLDSSDGDNNSQPSYMIYGYFKNKTKSKDKNIQEESSIANKKSIILKTSTTSSDDYFRSKMQEKNEGCGEIESVTTVSKKAEGKIRKRKITTNTEQCNSSTSMNLEFAEKEATKIRIKKTKIEKHTLDTKETNTNDIQTHSEDKQSESNVQKNLKATEEITFKTKNKKNKRYVVQDNLELDLACQNELDSETEKCISTKKKKKKHVFNDDASKTEATKINYTETDTKETNTNDIQTHSEGKQPESNVQKNLKATEEITLKTKNKKRKRYVVQDNLELDLACQNELDTETEKCISTKKKKKKHVFNDDASKTEATKINYMETNSMQTHCSVPASKQLNLAGKRTNKKKNRDVQDNLELVSSCQTELDYETEKNNTAKKMKKLSIEDETLNFHENIYIKHKKNKTNEEKNKNITDKQQEMEDNTNITALNSTSNNENETKIESKTHNQVKKNLKNKTVEFSNKIVKQIVPSKENINTWDEFHTYYNTYQIASYVAEKFRHFRQEDFKNSNILEIDGYSLDKSMKLQIVERKEDEDRILQFWEKTIDKYGNIFKTKPKRKPFRAEKNLTTKKAHKASKKNKHQKKFKQKSAFKIGI